MSVLETAAWYFADVAICIIAMLAPRLYIGRRRATQAALSARSRRRPLKESVRRGATQAALSAELNRHLRACPRGGVADMLASLLEHCGEEAVTPELLAAVRAALKSRDMKPQGRLLDLTLRAHLALRLQGGFDEVVAEVGGVGHVPIGVALLSSQAALQSSGLEAALVYMGTFAPQWRASFAETSSAVAQRIFREIVLSAFEQEKMLEVLQQLDSCGLFTPWAMDFVLATCMQLGEAALMRTVAAHCTLVKAATGDAAVLEIYDTSLRGADVCADTLAARRIVEAAVRCRRIEVTADVLAASREAPGRVALLESFASEGRHGEAMAVLRACPEKDSSCYNAALKAHIVGGRDMPSLQRIMSGAEAAGATDELARSMMMVAHLRAGDLRAARAALEAMQIAGFEPDVTTFNELINASIGINVHDAWELVGEMKAHGLKPDKVTCWIFLQERGQTSRDANVARTMALLRSVEEMDEVLLSSACEMLIRLDRPELLRDLLAWQRSDRTVPVRGAHTFRVLIRAHGYARDVRGVWDTWRSMLMQRVAPTRITAMRMVEALVRNGDTHAGYELLTQLRLNPETRGLVHSAMYASVVRGFFRERRFDEVWAVYGEALAGKVEFHLVTFHRLIDACAQNGESGRIPCLMEEMRKQKVRPSLVTYSIVIKSYCREGNFGKALELLVDMRQTVESVEFQPDEITYASLLCACAREGLYEMGIAVLDEMQAQGLCLSNFMLLPLANWAFRSRQPHTTVELCRAISGKYGIRLDAQIYNRLIKACVVCGDGQRACDVFGKMLADGAHPGSYTYAYLLRGCISLKWKEDAVRAAAGLPRAHPRGSARGGSSSRGGLDPAVLAEVPEGISNQCGDSRLAVELFRGLKTVPDIKPDPALLRRLDTGVTKRRWNRRSSDGPSV